MVGTGRKKTGCRRRNVIKEDLIAEERRWVSVVLPWVYILGGAHVVGWKEHSMICMYVCLCDALKENV